MQDYFYTIAATLTGLLRGKEVFTCAFGGEETDFVRFNHGQVRQAGHVMQRSITLDLIDGCRHASAELTLSGDLEVDRPRLLTLVEDLRELRAHVPEDPYLRYATEIRSSERLFPNRLPAGTEMVARVWEAGQGKDLVGIHASGAMHVGFVNSLGQRNWLTRHSFNLDWSLYLRTDKAVKARYAGFEWDTAALAGRMAAASEQLEAIERPARTLRPGRYRVYLTPMALDEIMELLGWNGFGLRAQRTGVSPLLRMIEDDVRLHPALTITENTADGVAPDFQEAGFLRPAQVTLIANGRYRDCLVAPRSAAEYEVPDNGADEGEAPLSLDVAPGSLVAGQILSSLDTGLYVGNLWYLNWSDRNAARLTGMTRFATFWVENGCLRAPVNVMRFDDTLYRLLGERLLGLTTERELLLDPGSYGGRSSRSARLPGMLVDEVNFTL